jgi:hypothetical protein
MRSTKLVPEGEDPEVVTALESVGEDPVVVPVAAAVEAPDTGLTAASGAGPP